MLQLSDREWAEFRVGDLFNVKYGKFIKNNKEGNIPYITTTAKNNGVGGLVDGTPMYNGNAITVASDGSIGAAFYQGKPFSTSNIVSTLEPLPDTILNAEIALFICTLIREEGKKYNYGKKFSVDRVRNTVLKLPSIDGIPDYQFMHDYIAEREPDYSWATQCIEPNAELSLTDREWAEFRVGDLFTFTRGKRITKKFADENPGIIPVIAGGESNNGILCYLSEECKNCRILKDGCISVAAFGTAGCVHYHNYKCFIDDKAIALNIKDNRFDKNKYVNLFMVCTLSKLSDRYSYGRGVTVDRYSDEVINLPITQDGTPDYDFMERYIKSLPFSKVLEAVTL